MRSARGHSPIADRNPATKRRRIVAKAARTIKRRFENGAGQYTESNSQYILRIGILAKVPIPHGKRNQMIYSLTTSLLPLLFCVLGIVGGYYIFRS